MQDKQPHIKPVFFFRMIVASNHCKIRCEKLLKSEQITKNFAERKNLRLTE